MVTRVKYLLIYIVTICFSCQGKTENKTNIIDFKKNDIADTLLINKGDFDKNIDSINNIKDYKFRLETSINGISLLDSESLLKVISLPVFIDNGSNNFPEMIILNSKKTEKLTLLFYPGSKKNEVSYFILEKNDTSKNIKGDNVFILNIENFITNNNIALESNKDTLLNKYKSSNIKLNKEHKQNGQEILMYVIDDFENPFLKEYNMPIYTAKYYSNNKKIVKVEFGFEYP